MYIIFSTKHTMKRPIYLKEIKKKILSAKNDSVFVSTDFTDITDKKTASVCLARLEADGIIKRIFRGIYYKPEYNVFLEEYIAPMPDSVAHALARNNGWTIIPSGDAVLNLLGLSTQVPATWVYMSNGPYKQYTYGNTSIQFKRTTAKETSNISYKTALIIQALKALGKENIDDAAVKKMERALTISEKKAMLEEAKSVTSWIYKYIKILYGGQK